MANYSPEGHLPASILAEGMGKERGVLLRARGAAPCCGRGQDAVSQPRTGGGGHLDEKRLSCWEAAKLAVGNRKVSENQDTFPGRPVQSRGL